MRHPAAQTREMDTKKKIIIKKESFKENDEIVKCAH